MSSAGGQRGKRKAPVNERKISKTVVKKPRKPKGMPDFQPGEVVVDLVKKKWLLGDLIGWGGFGALYYASANMKEPVSDNAVFVAKVEPYSNGPLFGELAFYQRAAKEETIKNWLTSHKLKFLGVPAYIGSGLHENNGSRYRFMIMERFGEDVDQIFEKCNYHFHIQTVFTLAIRILDILEFIHAQGYVHADIKGSNLMMGYSKSNSKNKVFLVDYGLACRYNSDNNHKEYKEDPKRRHDGTIEFTSRDAHKGVAPSRRTDLEILGYVMLKWLCTTLPWEDKLSDKNYVMNSKIDFMDKIPKSIKECLKDEKADELEQYFNYIVSLKYEELPDYDNLRKIFQDGLRKRKLPDDGQTVIFETAESPSHRPVRHGLDSDENVETKVTSKRGRGRISRGRKATSSSSSKEPTSPLKSSSPKTLSRRNKSRDTSNTETSEANDEVITARSSRRRKAEIPDISEESGPLKRPRRNIAKKPSYVE